MATRYFSFDELENVSGNYKPAGTMGNHRMTVVHQGEETIVFGFTKGRITMKKGDTLGYDSGRVWLVRSPESYDDPIRRWLAEKRIPQKVLRFSSDPVVTNQYGWSNMEAHALNGEHLSRWTQISGISNWLVSGADAVAITHVPEENFSISGMRVSDKGIRLEYLQVRPNADKTKVVEWLSHMALSVNE